MGVASFFMGFAAAFYLGWFMTVLLLVIVPVLTVTGVMFTEVVQSSMKEQMKAYAQSAGYAEQAIAAIKVVHTYGQELLEMKNYNKYLLQAKQVGKRQAFKKALGNTSAVFMFFCFYSYTFFVGTLLKYNKVEMSPEVVYTGGAIIGIMFCVVFGGFSLGGAAPHFAAMAEGKVAGRMAFEVIDHKPSIISNDTSKQHYD